MLDHVISKSSLLEFAVLLTSRFGAVLPISFDAFTATTAGLVSHQL